MKIIVNGEKISLPQNSNIEDLILHLGYQNQRIAIEINESRFGPIYKNRGYVRQQQNKIDDAKQDYQNYIKFTPNAKDRGTIERALNEM